MRSLRLALESCRQGKFTHRIERLFLEYGGEYVIAVLYIAMRGDHKLFCDIDPLPDRELINLIKHIKRLLQKASIIEYLDAFAELPQGILLVSLTRPGF